MKQQEVRGITINTDASFYNQHKIGAFAFWIKSDVFKITKGGMFKTEILDSTQAEIYAIGNAIACLLQQPDLPQANFLVINTDCTYAIKQITERRSIDGNKVYHLWQQLIKKIGSKKNSFRHVRAHTGKNNPRSFVNEWCDTEAKKWAKEAIRIKQEKQRANELNREAVS